MTAPARTAAFHALLAIARERMDLPVALADTRSRLADERDRGLTSAIVTGTLRWQRAMDHLIEHFSRRTVAKLDEAVVIILRLIGMSISMSSMTAYGLRRTTVLGREMLRPEDALDLEKTARVALDAVTRITGEMALIALAVAAAATGVAFLLRSGDL